MNAHLIGRPGSLDLLDTPALCLDLELFERNLEAMASHCHRAGMALRPHAKTHKCVRIAERQIAAGASGVSCATLGEAEVMVRAGIPGVLVTSPQVTAAKIVRLIELNRFPHRGLTVVVDHPLNVAALDAAALAAGQKLTVLADFSVGQGRTGAAGVDELHALVRQIRETKALFFAGLQAYAGHHQHIPGAAARRQAADAEYRRLDEALRRLGEDGIVPGIVTGGGTGTHDIDAAVGLLTELQAGSYVFMDVDYQRALAADGAPPPFATALFVRTAVVSVNAAGQVTTDGGLKSFATDGPCPEIMRGAPAGSRYEFFGDEHGKVVLPPGAAAPRLAEYVDCVTPHCDPTVNLHDVLHVIRGDVLVDIWPIDARGKH